MSDYINEYKKWLGYENLDGKLRSELNSIKDEEEIEERFYKSLSFGTAGLRGKLGAGSNRMNIYTVAQATKALCRVILDEEITSKNGVAIAYDSRIMSEEFAKLAARIIASHNINAYIFDKLRPTPELSFAINKLNCIAGINITASHNPKEYNGYKVYWEGGAQIKDKIAKKILDKLNDILIFDTEKILEFDEGVDLQKIKIIGEEIDKAYLKEVETLSLNSDIDKKIKIVYTPLNGAGKESILKVLDDMGYENVYVVKEQADPDGTFKTVEYPNPEDERAFIYAQKYARQLNADIIIATDPDADRVAMQILVDDEIVKFNGNEIGILLANYILENKKIDKSKKYGIIKSIVTGDMVVEIAKKYGVKVFDVLTGFKNIADLQKEWDITKEYEFLFGFEESIGYNAGNFVRDKDAISSSLLIVEMAAYYKKRGKNLKTILDFLYEEYGYYKNETISLTFEGMSGQAKIAEIMENFRNNPPTKVNDNKIVEIIDYKYSTRKIIETGEVKSIAIEKTNAIKFHLQNESWFTIRPSGTEPKIKMYIYTKGNTLEAAITEIKNIGDFLREEVCK